MARMTAAQAAAIVLEKEGVTQAFGVPGCRDQPVLCGPEEAGSHQGISWRAHVEGASHMAEGYTRAKGRQYRRLPSAPPGPAGTDMITGPVFGAGRFHTYPLHYRPGAARPACTRKTSRAVDIESIAKPVTKWAVTVREPALVPIGVPGRPSTSCVPAVPARCWWTCRSNVQMAEIEFDPDTYQPLEAYKPKASRAQIEKGADHAERSGAPV